MVLPLPRTSISFGTGAECFLAQAGSASMVSGLRVGAFPSKVTVPVTDEAATATPGHANITPSPAASNNLPVARTIGSSVLVHAPLSAQEFDFEQTVHPTRQAGNPPAFAHVTSLARYGPTSPSASSRSRRSASRGGGRGRHARHVTRSRTRAILRAAGRAVERAPGVASASSPPPRSTRR